jgi:hypothetical protein
MRWSEAFREEMMEVMKRERAKEIFPFERKPS